MDRLMRGTAELWHRVSSKAKNGVIFMDNHCAECLHWCGGADLLFEAGANAIKEFSSFESGSEDQFKAVFVLSSPLTGKIKTTMRDIIMCSHFKECIVISTIDSKIHHYYDSDVDNPREDVSFFRQYEHNLVEWMGRVNASAEILHLPIFFTPVFSNLFITPAFDMLFPIQQKDLSELKLQEGEKNPTSLTDLHFYMFPKEYRTLLRMVASSFRSYFHTLGCKEEIFALGSTSHLLAIQLSNMANQQKTAHPNPLSVGVLFVDRTLDLMGPVSHSERSLVDQLLSILPGIPAHFNNISIDMSLLCDAKCEYNDRIVYSGCLVPDTKDSPLLSTSYNVKAHNAVTAIQGRLQDAVADEGLDEESEIETDCSSPANSIESLIGAFKGSPGAVIYHSALLQFGLAISQLLADPNEEMWRSLATAEKLILQQMGDDDASNIIEHIVRLTSAEEDVLIDFEDFCSVLIYASFALKNHIEADVYEKLANCICDLISNVLFEDLPENFISLFELTEDDLANRGRLSNIVYRLLNALSEIDFNSLQYFKTLKLSHVEPPSYRSLLSQIVERMLDSTKPNLEPDIEHVSTGRKDLLKMGISMFRKVTPPRPSDYSVLLIYVVGGVTATEVAQVNKVLEKFPTRNCQVVIGSNRLVSPSDIVDKALWSRNIYPEIHR